MTTRQQRKDRMDRAGLALSAASLGVGILALCLNEKKEDRMNKIDRSRYSKRRDLKKAYAKEIKRVAVSDIGYSGTVIVLNDKGEQRTFSLIPVENRKKIQEPRKKKSWVAMEINSKTKGDRQAIVCSSKEQARLKAEAMKKAHRKGSQKSKQCRQGYALMDTSEKIDVARWFSGDEGTMYRV